MPAARWPYMCHPLVELPSKSNFQPSFFSAWVKVLGAWAFDARGGRVLTATISIAGKAIRLNFIGSCFCALFLQGKDIIDHGPDVFRFQRGMLCHWDGAPDAAAAGDDLLHEPVDRRIGSRAVFGGYFAVSRADGSAGVFLVQAVAGGAVAGADELQSFVGSYCGCGCGSRGGGVFGVSRFCLT